jgi:hypothetical protein
MAVVSLALVLAAGAHAIAEPSSKNSTCTRLTPKFSVPAHVMPGHISSVASMQIAAGGPEEVVAVLTALQPLRGFSVHVLTFDSDGAIADRTLFPLPNSTVGVQYGTPLGGDFDGDDHPDLLIAWSNSQPSGGTHHDLFLGRPDGSFDASITLETSLYSGWELAGDVDGDGRTELIQQAGSEIRVYGFESGAGWSLEGVSALRADFVPALGDFDGDALLDLALVRFSQPDQITLAFGAAIAPLSEVRVIPFPSPSRLGSARAAQLDGAGSQEILILGRLSGGEPDLLAVSISATRDVATLLWEQTVPEFERAWTVRDIDGDGLDDVWFGPPANADTSPGFVLYLNRGSGPLVLGQRGTSAAGILATRDLDGDGLRDAILLHGKTFLWYRGVPGPAFDEGAIYSEASSTTEPLLGDLDEDGTLDFVSANGRSEQQFVAQVQFGNGDGTFRRGADVPQQDNSITLRLHDIDGDGHLDLLEPSRVTRLLEVHVAYGRGDGTFESPRRYSVPSGNGRLIFGDLDGDRDDDVLLVGSERWDREARWNRTPMYAVFVSGRIWIQGPEFSVFGTSLPEPTIGDINNDSRADVVYGSQARSGEWTIGWRTLLPTGIAFGDETVVKRWPENGPVTGLELLDLDGDGRNELFVRGGPAPYVARVFKRDDRGALRVIRQTPRVASFGRRSRLADIDVDGRSDDVISDHWAIRWHRGDGEGGFDAVTDGWYHYGAPGVADLDHDGRPDLIGLHNNGSSATRLLVVNHNRGTYAAEDAQPPAVELRLLPFVDDEERPADFDDSWRVQLIATDDCDAVPIVTRRRLDLEPPPAGAQVLYRAGEGFEIRYWIVPGTGTGTVLLIGNDEAMARARWAAILAAGGFALEPGQLVTLAITSVDGASPSALGDNGLIPAAARLAARYVEQGARLRSATESRAGADITVSTAVADRAGNLVEVRASLAEEKRRYCEQGGAAAVVCP